MALREMVPWRKHEASGASPFRSFQREMDRLFDRFFGEFGGSEALAEREGMTGAFYPSIDVSENDKEIHVTAELPGLDQRDLDISLSGNNLVIRGEKKAEKEEKGEHFFHRESSYGSFYRTIPLTEEIEEEGVDATFRNGVLTVTLPKSERAKQARKRIPIH